MKTHTTSAGMFLRAMADCIEHDPASMDGWCCLDLPGLLNSGNPQERLALLSAPLQSLEGALVAIADGGLMIFYRGVAGAGQGRLQQQIQEFLDLPECPVGQVYELFSDWKQALDLFRAEISQLDSRLQQRRQQSLSAEEEGGIRHMAEVLRESKFSRQYRSPMTVMLVEDDPVTRHMAGKLLGQHNVLVTAGNAYEAVVNYLIYAPELVFLDINLPDQSGLSVLDQLTACDPDAYIVMFSGNDGIENIVDARNRGARGFVAKPFQRDRLKHFLTERQEISERLRREMMS